MLAGALNFLFHIKILHTLKRLQTPVTNGYYGVTSIVDRASSAENESLDFLQTKCVVITKEVSMTGTR